MMVGLMRERPTLIIILTSSVTAAARNEVVAARAGRALNSPTGGIPNLRPECEISLNGVAAIAMGDLCRHLVLHASRSDGAGRPRPLFTRNREIGTFGWWAL
jgi:hypothetical protein